MQYSRLHPKSYAKAACLIALVGTFFTVPFQLITLFFVAKAPVNPNVPAVSSFALIIGMSVGMLFVMLPLVYVFGYFMAKLYNRFLAKAEAKEAELKAE